MNKKNMNLIKSTAFVLSLIFSQAVLAQTQEGFYKGKFKDEKGRNAGKVKVFINEITNNGAASKFALVISDKKKKAAVFRIESLQDGTEAWVKVVAKQNGLVQASPNQDATFSVSYVKDGSGHELVMTPTAYANQQGCKFEIQAKPSSSQSWVSVPSEATVFKKNKAKQEVRLSQQTMSGRFILNGLIKNQSYGVSEVVKDPQGEYVAAIRAQALDSESEDGRALNRQVTGLISVIRKNGLRLEIIQVSNGGCLDPFSTLRD